MKKSLISLLLIVLLVFSCFAEGAAEKVAAYDEIVAEQEKLANSAASSRKSGTVSLYTDLLGGSGTTRPAVAGKQIVGAGNALAPMAGYNILQQGGTAFDAALAIAGVQSIVEGGMTNILGGDAMIMVWSAEDQKATVINGTGWAPEKATIDFYLEQGGIPSSGALSVQIPGAWAGWMTLLEMYGTMPLEDILAPVIERAEGTYVDSAMMSPIRSGSASTVDESMRKIYTKADGSAYQIGDVWSNPDLVATLNSLVEASKQGATNKEGYTLAKDYYYRGPLAEKVVAWNNANGGIFTLEDFSEFDAEVTEPWSTTFRGYEVLVCPPNSQGPTLLEALNILENFDLESYEHNSAEYIDLLVQTLNIAINDRNYNWGDTRFVEPDMTVLSKEYAAEMAAKMTLGTAMDEIPEGKVWVSFDEKGSDTTFMYVADKYGNIVVSTHSLCNSQGSKCVAEGTGITLNNRMIYFLLDETLPNYLAPHKRTMQTITPTIGLKDGKPAFVLGTPGADNQEQEKLQVLLNAIVYGYTNPQQAIEQTRFITKHPAGLMNPNQMPQVIQMEPGDISDETIMELEDMGYTIIWGNLRCIGFAWIDENGYKWGGEDPRWPGYAVAW